MRTKVLLVCLTLATASCAEIKPFAPDTGSTAQATGSDFLRSCASQYITSANFVATKVRYLGAFDPLNNGGSGEDGKGKYTPPTDGGMLDGNSPEAKRLVAAWENASPSLQDRLCGLKRLFVDGSATIAPSDKWGWGFWENPRYQSSELNGKTGSYAYVSIPYDVLTKTASSLDVVEGAVLKLILSNLDQWRTVMNGDYDGPAYLPPTPSDIDPISAILAHEMGHVVFLDSDVPTALLTANNCFSASFAPSWGKILLHRFTRFAADNDDNDYGLRNKRNKKIRQINQDIRADKPQHFTTAYADFNVVYGGEWASLFASVSPVEDFVETYALLQMMAGPRALTSLPFQNGVPQPNGKPGKPIDIVTLRNSPTNPLYKKAECVKSVL